MQAPTTQPETPVNTLELDDVECSRGGRSLFKGLSLHVKGGTLLRIEGKNGAGKTSLLRMLCGLAAPSQGKIRWNGSHLREQRAEFNQNLVYLGHAPALKDDLTAVENLQSAMMLCGSFSVSHKQAKDALAQSGLYSRTHVPVRTLSQGQRKRVALARLALSKHAPLWILDEPLNALDAMATNWLLGLMAKQVHDGGIVVLTSHQAVNWSSAPPELSIQL
jgi:heme exporter protein A